MSTVTEKEANEKISKLIAQAHALINEAEAIADEAGVGFSWDLSYGMGGWYTSRKAAAKNEGVDLERNPDWQPSDSGWRASSQSC